MPPGSWLTAGYAEWQPPAALSGLVACLWASVTPDRADQPGLVLPDACSDLIWAQGVGGYVAGPDTGPVRTLARAGYADQPHLTRECRALSGYTPAALHRVRRPAADGPAAG